MKKTTHQPVITLNGQSFNANTGKLIDGVRRISYNNVDKTSIPPAAKRKRAVTSSKSVHKSTELSHTLMRKAVARPSIITTRKTVAMDVVAHAPNQTLNQIFHAPVVNRLNRAQKVTKLATITRFGSNAVSPRQPSVAQFNAYEPKPTISPVAASTTSLGLVKPVQSTVTNRMLDKGLRNANSHVTHKASKTKLHHRIGYKLGLSKRATSIAASMTALLLFGAFFMYQNVPNINVRYAASKAGVNAVMPGYHPAGFTVNNHIRYSPGIITISYKANADDRSYDVSQTNTSWNSDALRDHLAYSAGTNLQTYPKSGQTIFLHDGTQADWINNGVWYSISGSSNLTTDQLIKIADSI